MTKVIYKATVAKQSGNWDIWCTFLTHTGVEDKLLDGIQHGAKTTLVSSFVESVQRKQFVTTKKDKLLHGTVKAAISDISVPFRTALWSDPTLYTARQKHLILKSQLRGYKSLNPPTKHHK